MSFILSQGYLFVVNRMVIYIPNGCKFRKNGAPIPIRTAWSAANSSARYFTESRMLIQTLKCMERQARFSSFTNREIRENWMPTHTIQRR